MPITDTDKQKHLEAAAEHRGGQLKARWDKERGRSAREDRRRKKLGLPAEGCEGRREIAVQKLEEPGQTLYGKPIPGREPRKAPAAVNVRESSIAHMHSRKRISDIQRAAADKFRSVYEAAQIGLGAIDYGKIRVDGGGKGDPLTDRVMQANRTIVEISRLVGQRSMAILTQVAGQGLGIAEVAQRWTSSGGIVAGDRAEGYVTGTLVDALDMLVDHWGLRGSTKDRLPIRVAWDEEQAAAPAVIRNGYGEARARPNTPALRLQPVVPLVPVETAGEAA